MERPKNRQEWLNAYNLIRSKKEELKFEMAEKNGLNINNEDEEGLIETSVNAYLIAYKKYIDDNYPELDWVKAKEYLDEVRQNYTSIGSAGLLALQLTINPLLIKFEKGDRSKDLYDEIMSLE